MRFSQLITQPQLQQLVRLTVWKDQQQPWTVHAITCLLQDLLEADKQFNAVQNASAAAGSGGNAAADGVADGDTGGATDDQMNVGDASTSAAAGTRAQHQLPTQCKE